jgi:hypothetical protein
VYLSRVNKHEVPELEHRGFCLDNEGEVTPDCPLVIRTTGLHVLELPVAILEWVEGNVLEVNAVDDSIRNPPAHHNLNLEDDFFAANEDVVEVSTAFGANLLSTHYFISRVLHDLALASTNSSFVRNSLFVRFFDDALPVGIGQFAPLKCHVFKKT